METWSGAMLPAWLTSRCSHFRDRVNGATLSFDLLWDRILFLLDVFVILTLGFVSVCAVGFIFLVTRPTICECLAAARDLLPRSTCFSPGNNNQASMFANQTSGRDKSQTAFPKLIEWLSAHDHVSSGSVLAFRWGRLVHRANV